MKLVKLRQSDPQFERWLHLIFKVISRYPNGTLDLTAAHALTHGDQVVILGISSSEVDEVFAESV